MRIVYAGGIGRFPVGGHAWVDMNYLAGMVALGHDVYYVEECGHGSWVYDWAAQEVTTDLGYPTAYVSACLDQIGLGDRWAYRAGDQCVGMPADSIEDICAEADVFFVRGCSVPLWRAEYLRARTRVFVDSDPGFTQIRALTGDSEMAETIDRANRLFTIGHNVGREGCPVPTLGRSWTATEPPVSLAHWPAVPADEQAPLSTVLQWRSYADVEFGGVSYGNKNGVFPAYFGLPEITGADMTVALTGLRLDEMRSHGWTVVEGWCATEKPEDYAAFITRSRAEFSVAKQGYVAARTGWFSDRSTCYLASGRPVIVQDTGLDRLSGGGGVLTFSGPAGAAQQIGALRDDYDRHCREARALAERVFAAHVVLPPLLETW